MSKRYIPDVGDIIHVHFDTGLQSSAPDYKPAVILSPQAYNKRTGLIVCCPITERANDYPFEVLIDDKSEILSDQVKSRSEEHTSELQSLMRISYAVFCLKKKKKTQT